MTNTENLLDSPRVRFNWGFWDGLYEQRNNKTIRTAHTNPHYAAGYKFGYQEISENVETSEPAWQRHTA